MSSGLDDDAQGDAPIHTPLRKVDVTLKPWSAAAHRPRPLSKRPQSAPAARGKAGVAKSPSAAHGSPQGPLRDGAERRHSGSAAGSAAGAARLLTPSPPGAGVAIHPRTVAFGDGKAAPTTPGSSTAIVTPASNAPVAVAVSTATASQGPRGSVHPVNTAAAPQSARGSAAPAGTATAVPSARASAAPATPVAASQSTGDLPGPPHALQVPSPPPSRRVHSAMPENPVAVLSDPSYGAVGAAKPKTKLPTSGLVPCPKRPIRRSKFPTNYAAK